MRGSWPRSLGAGVQVPVSRDLNGTALKHDDVFTTGFRINFRVHCQMQLRTVAKWGRNITIALLVPIAGGWLAFVPSAEAKEPPCMFVTAWGEKGSAPEQFNDPTGIAVAGDEVFVSDSRNGRIQAFDLDGQSKRLIGKAGSGPGEIEAPGGVAVASNGDLFVADFYSHRVQQLKPDCVLARQWAVTGETGHGAVAFIYPTDVALDRNGTLYVADGYASRIQVFDIAGKPVNKWGGPFAVSIPGPLNGWFRVVTGIDFGPQGDLFAAAVADDGTVFAVDCGNNRVQKWCQVGDRLQ